MDTRRIAPAALAIALALDATATPAQAPDTGDPATLEPLTVTAPVAPLDRSLHLLRLLVEQSAPCLGCDAVAARGNPLLGYLLASEPPEPSGTELMLLDIKLKDSRDLEFLRP